MLSDDPKRHNSLPIPSPVGATAESLLSLLDNSPDALLASLERVRSARMADVTDLDGPRSPGVQQP
ncbi:MAG: hypothetical protein NVSMB27_45760 [Ktedonobacteraceae bacterium]